MTTSAAVQHRHVLVVEDEVLLRTQLVHSLAQSGFSVTAHGSVQDLADAALADAPCVALLDMRLGDGSGVDALHLLRQRQPGLAVVFISGGSDPQEIVQAMKLGAVDFLVKPFTLDTLRAALERGMAQEQARRAREAHQGHARSLFARLTPREREFSQRLAQGLPAAELAAHLGLAQELVETYRLQVFDKLGVDSQSCLMGLLRSAGLEDAAPEPFWAAGVDLPIDVPMTPAAADRQDPEASVS